MFEFSLRKPTRGLPDGATAGQLEDADDYEYLVMYSCSLLSETDCKFHIGGFGKEDWAFDVEGDMSSFIEELPLLLKGLASEEEVEIYLYTQGVERKLIFTPMESRVIIRCVSETDWTPSPDEEEMALGELVVMTEKLARDFSDSLTLIAPQVAQLPPFSQWKSGT